MIYYGAAARIIFTALTFLYITPNVTTMWLWIPIILTLLDTIDSNYLMIQSQETVEQCVMYNKTYHTLDKWVDSLSYLSVYVLFQYNDPILLGFILYRFIGVILLTVTQKRTYLFYLFDFVKEYMVIHYLFPSTPIVWILCLPMKIVFEYMFHVVHYNPMRALIPRPID